jgi:hypothetical protein
MGCYGLPSVVRPTLLFLSCHPFDKLRASSEPFAVILNRSFRFVILSETKDLEVTQDRLRKVKNLAKGRLREGSCNDQEMRDSSRSLS